MENATQEKTYISFPQWEGSVYCAWAKNFCYKNQWRVTHSLGDYDDCLAQCRLYYWQTWQFYDGQFTSPKHLMYMFRLWTWQQFHDLSNMDTKIRKVEADPDPDMKLSDPETYSEGELAVKLNKASSELKEVLNIMFNAPQEVMDVIRQDSKNFSPKQFFRRVVKYLGFEESKTAKLTKELQELLQ